MGRASVLLALIAVLAPSCTDDPALPSPGGRSSAEGPSPTSGTPTTVEGSPRATLNVRCHGHSTTIDERVVRAGPAGVSVSTQLDRTWTGLLFDGREHDVLIVDHMPAFANLEPGRHTVGCMFEGDIVLGAEPFEVVDPDGHYIDPLGECRISGMADFEPKTVGEDALVSAAARTWRVPVDQIVTAGYPDSPDERAFVAYDGPASPTGVVWFSSRNDGTWRSTSLVTCEGI
jgi:hypothetical protein